VSGLLASVREALAALESPGWLALALALAALGLVLALRRGPDAIPWSAWPEATEAGAHRHDPARVLGLAARALAITLLGVALAGPVTEHRAPPPPGEGLDVLLVVDTSDSMRALDAQAGGEWRTRLALAREVVARFARERAVEGDRVGLVVFGETAFTQCPLTGDGRLLAAALERIQAGMAGGSTALGDALALAVKRVTPAGVDRARGAPAAGRVIVLLTDGRSNAGSVPPDVATALAVARGVRVHTVGIGSRGEVAMEGEGGAGRGLRFERHDLDAATLAAIAGATGGRAFQARSQADLEAVYAEIDSLERVARRPPPRVRRTAHPEPWLAAAGLLVAGELAFGRGLLRRIP
jgi:Ca-activated chloride channel family protein